MLHGLLKKFWSKRGKDTDVVEATTGVLSANFT
jgi:hypothetical protein